MNSVCTINTIDTRASIATAIDQWCIELEKQAGKANTYKTYNRIINLHKKWLIDNGLEYTQASKGDLLNWLSSISNLSVGTQKLYLTVIRQFYKWLCEIAFINGNINYLNPTNNLKINTRQARQFKKSSLNADQAKAMLTTIDDNTLQGKRNLAILRLMVTCGIRCIEISRLRIGDIIERNGVAMLNIRGKRYNGEVSRSIVIPEKVNYVLRQWTKSINKELLKNDNAPLFHSIRKKHGSQLTSIHISRIAKQAIKQAVGDKKEYTAHSLRHTAATLALLNGADQLEVKENLGHSDFNTTLIYVHHINATKNKANSLVDSVL